MGNAVLGFVDDDEVKLAGMMMESVGEGQHHGDLHRLGIGRMAGGDDAMRHLERL